MYNKDEVLALLKQRGIKYELCEHAAAFTIDEMDTLGIPHCECVLKNLFLRDQKGQRHFLVSMLHTRRADLSLLAQRLGSGKLSFASEQRLEKYLGLSKGAVTPLGALNDEGHAVEVVFDAKLEKLPLVGIHPLVNTASVFLNFADLKDLLTSYGSDVRILSLDD